MYNVIGVMIMTIADRIRNRRLELGLSVDELVARLHKNRATVYRYESNSIKNYYHDVINSLAEALDTTPAYFYGYDDQKESEDLREQISDEEHSLFRLAKDAKPEALRAAVAVLKSYEETNDDF